jgi:hypothetical protein
MATAMTAMAIIIMGTTGDFFAGAGFGTLFMCG